MKLKKDKIEEQVKEVRDLYDRQITNATLNNDEFVLGIHNQIEISKKLWELFGNIVVSKMKDEKRTEEEIMERFNFLDQEVITKIDKIFIDRNFTMFESLFAIEKMRFVSLMSFLSSKQEGEDKIANNKK